MGNEKTVSEQISDFVRLHSKKVDTEKYSVIEFIIQAGRLDGMRVKEYIKNRNSK